MKLSIVIPVYGATEPVEEVIQQIPAAKLRKSGVKSIEMIIVFTPRGNEKLVLGDVSSEQQGFLSIRVIEERRRGYGQAYITGFNEVQGDIVVTLDADLTYPTENLDKLVRLVAEKYWFLNTNRLKFHESRAFHTTNLIGNHLLTLMMNVLFCTPFRDSQSGMWVFRREVLQFFNLKEKGMPLSTEIKLEAHRMLGDKCTEVPIAYRRRGGGYATLHWAKDGARIVTMMFKRRLRL